MKILKRFKNLAEADKLLRKRIESSCGANGETPCAANEEKPADIDESTNGKSGIIRMVKPKSN